MTWLLSRTACSGDRSISCTVCSSSWYAFSARCILRTGSIRAGPRARGVLGTEGGHGHPGGSRPHLRAQAAASFLSISAIS